MGWEGASWRPTQAGGGQGPRGCTWDGLCCAAWGPVAITLRQSLWTGLCFPLAQPPAALPGQLVGLLLLGLGSSQGGSRSFWSFCHIPGALRGATCLRLALKLPRPQSRPAALPAELCPVRRPHCTCRAGVCFPSLSPQHQHWPKHLPLKGHQPQRWPTMEAVLLSPARVPRLHGTARFRWPRGQWEGGGRWPSALHVAQVALAGQPCPEPRGAGQEEACLMGGR